MMRRSYAVSYTHLKVIEGMDVVNKIAETPTDYSDRPLEDQVMESVTVDTFGETYPEPNKLDR